MRHTCVDSARIIPARHDEVVEGDLVIVLMIFDDF